MSKDQFILLCIEAIKNTVCSLMQVDTQQGKHNARCVTTIGLKINIMKTFIENSFSVSVEKMKFRKVF